MSDGIRNLAGINLGAVTSSSQNDETPGPAKDTTPSPQSTQFPPLPEAPPSKVFGSGYNEYHPVPTVQSYKADQKVNEQAADEYARIVAQRQREQEERLARHQRDAEAVSAKQEGKAEDGTVKDQGNEAKIRQNNKQDSNAKKPATEKERMMDQMNSNQRECGVGIGLTCRETYGPVQQG